MWCGEVQNGNHSTCFIGTGAQTHLVSVSPRSLCLHPEMQTGMFGKGMPHPVSLVYGDETVWPWPQTPPTDMSTELHMHTSHTDTHMEGDTHLMRSVVFPRWAFNVAQAGLRLEHLEPPLPKCWDEELTNQVECLKCLRLELFWNCLQGFWIAEGQGEGSGDRSACCHAWLPEFGPWDPHKGRRREVIPQRYSTYMLRHTHMHTFS